MSSLKDSLTHYITSDEIQKAVYQIAKEIEIDFHGREIVLIAPLKGSFLFLSDLCRQISLMQIIDFVYYKSMKSRQSVEIIKDIEVNVTNKHVIIVEEIIDAGRTLSFLYTRLRASNPASIKIATLLDKPARRELPIRPDYCGITIDDRYVVGYGMDSEEQGRNYPNIYSFKM